ncbi:MAG: sigma-70 family RNA polymerase sigma factor [Planctomycetes bacterium]|nr:sigma-70 family RNA polymerase sigma factor [Planctomycetota bacterium]
MPQRSDEDLFRAFQRRRDCDALGILFRRRAQELVRLAVFVAPSPSDAEDLVQATFLTAITRAETFRDDGLVMSWMSGILSNHARMLHRAASRRVPVQDDRELGGEPIDAALHSELRAALKSCIASLPEPYHSVLALHLHGGLDSQEIAQRLGRPPATVRKQIERAIDRLRQALPLGLATGLVLRLSPEAMAQNAANAARYGEVMAADAEPRAQPSGRFATFGRRGLAIVLAAVVLVGIAAWSAWPAAPDHPIAVADLAVRADAEALPDAPGSGPAAVVATEAARAPAATFATLTVQALRGDGVAEPGVDLVLLPFSDRSLVERMATGFPVATTTAGDGCARFDGLAPGWYQILQPGTAAGSLVSIGASDQRAQVMVSPPQRVHGRVLDERGAPIEGAEVIASTNASGIGLGVVLARSASDGTFAGTTHFIGRLWARHLDFGPSIGVRMEADRELRLVLPKSQRTVTVVTLDATGRPLSGCCVGVVPRSDSNQPLLPQHGVSDASGRCTFADPGPGEATVVASRDDRAASLCDLAKDAREIVVTLADGGDVQGVARADDGTPLAGREVTAAVPSLRTNEPAGNLVGRVAMTDRDGAFRFASLPSGPVHLRITAPTSAPLLTYPPPLLACATVEVVPGRRTPCELRILPGARLTGRVVAGAVPQPGWLVVAVPEVGTAAHRKARTRAALTDATGSFAVVGVNIDDGYQIGAFPPSTVVQRAMPFVVQSVAPGCTTVGDLVVDPRMPPNARLRCRIVDPVGRPLPGVSLELRPLAFQAPTTKTSGADGVCEFAGLSAGDYWLARLAPGSGSRTVAVAVPARDAVVDLGDLVVEAPAALTVVVVGAPSPVVRVVVRHDIGDRYLEAMADARGVAKLPLAAPGPIRLLVHGPGFAPVHRELVLVSGPQDVQVEVQPAATLLVTLDFPPAENPLNMDGPLHFQVFDARDRLVFEDHVGRAVAKGTFKLVTGLPAGDYRLHARAIWNASARVAFHVDAASTTRVSAGLRL